MIIQLIKSSKMIMNHTNIVNMNNDIRHGMFQFDKLHFLKVCKITNFISDQIIYNIIKKNRVKLKLWDQYYTFYGITDKDICS